METAIKRLIKGTYNAIFYVLAYSLCSSHQKKHLESKIETFIKRAKKL